MHSLSQLKNTSRPPKKSRRIGRGIGSKRGKNAGRGEKGDSHRQGYSKRFGYEGGQVPLYRKLPIRGFTRGAFIKPTASISLSTIQAYFEDGDTVSLVTLREKGLIPRRVPGGIKILSNGELTKKVTIEAKNYSEAAEQKLKDLGISFTKV
ncbi:MAG: 50S ribosomal protein L15 [Chlamydiae bacterium CG10_big_fil_rev_8_21_14_0_10_42_34]|nr:MAG: 50S ribosomal protein L15 [Chlamydiae bacterium CG10_big_fil_rev_8_21_14_0_10_42_34]